MVSVAYSSLFVCLFVLQPFKKEGSILSSRSHTKQMAGHMLFVGHSLPTPVKHYQICVTSKTCLLFTVLQEATIGYALLKCRSKPDRGRNRVQQGEPKETEMKGKRTPQMMTKLITGGHLCPERRLPERQHQED